MSDTTTTYEALRSAALTLNEVNRFMADISQTLEGENLSEVGENEVIQNMLHIYAHMALGLMQLRAVADTVLEGDLANGIAHDGNNTVN